MFDSIIWEASVVEEVISRATAAGWTHHTTQEHQGHLVILHRDPDEDSVKTYKLNVWCTTGTVGSYLKHPKRKSPTQLFRREVETWPDFEAILANPRVHTDKGYSRRPMEGDDEASSSPSNPTPGNVLGEIKWWSFRMGYGFVTPDDGSEDVFFHKRGKSMGMIYGDSF